MHSIRTPDGLLVLGYTSFPEDVLGQMARRKLQLGIGEALVVTSLLPAIAEAMALSGLTYLHCGLGQRARGQVSVVGVRGTPHRLSIFPFDGLGDVPPGPRLALDSHWSCSAPYRHPSHPPPYASLRLIPSTTLADLRAMMEAYVSAVVA